MMRKVVPILAVLVAIVAFACGGAKEDAVPSAVSEVSPPETTSVVDATLAEVVAVEAEKPASEMADEAPVSRAVPDLAGAKPKGGIFRRLWSDPPTLDPHLTSDTTSAGVVVELYSGLVVLDTNLMLVPDIAERWEIDDTGTVYTLYLRKNALFHDGKPVTASDFKWSLERAANPKTASPVADTYLNDIIGAQDVFDGLATDLSGIRVIDDYTLQITIDAPKAYFLAKLTYPTAYVLDRENVEAGGRNWFDTPNGTGPFRLGEYRVGERIILERNDNYYREPAHLDKVVMNLAGGQSMAMYENNEIDITRVGLFNLDRVLDPSNPLNKDLVISPPDFVVTYIGFNTSQPPFDDRNFRQALNHAIDKRLIAKEVLSSLVVPAYGVIPPGFPAYNPNLVGLEYEPELAKKLLADSQYADPDTRPPIVITIPGTGGTPSLSLEVVMEMWRQILGVEVEIRQVEWATYLKDLDKQSFQSFAGLGWEADYPDPQDFLDILFHTESGINHGGYSNVEVDAILEEARVEPDVARRMALYNKAEQMIVDDAAWVPMWFEGERHVLIKPHIKGFKMTPMIISKLREVYIE